jgi:hypothetical protein
VNAGQQIIIDEASVDAQQCFLLSPTVFVNLRRSIGCCEFGNERVEDHTQLMPLFRLGGWFLGQSWSVEADRLRQKHGG